MHRVVDARPGNHPAAAPWGRGWDARSKAEVCTHVYRCVCWGGVASCQRARNRVGSCWKTRLPNTRHTEGYCMYPGQLITLVGTPGSWETAGNSSPGSRTGPSMCRGLRSDGGFSSHSLLNVDRPSGVVSALPTPAVWTLTPNNPPHYAGLLREALARTAGTVCRQAWAQSAGSRLPGRAGSLGQGGLGVTAWLAFPVLPARETADTHEHMKTGAPGGAFTYYHPHFVNQETGLRQGKSAKAGSQ